MFSSSAISRLIHETEERNVVTYTTILSQTAWRSQQSYLYHQPQPNLIFKARYCFCSSRTRCWIESIASTLRFNLFICFCVFCGCLLEPRGFIKYEVYQTFSAQLFWRASVIHHWQLHRHESVSAGTGAMHFWKWFMRSKINNVAWSACKVQPLNGSVADKQLCCTLSLLLPREPRWTWAQHFHSSRVL